LFYVGAYMKYHIHDLPGKWHVVFPAHDDRGIRPYDFYNAQNKFVGTTYARNEDEARAMLYPVLDPALQTGTRLLAVA